MIESYMPFHGHSTFSARDGCNSVEDIVKKHAELGFKRVCLTDHGNFGNEHKLKKACQKYGLKPSIGIEFYMIQDKYKHASTKNKTFTNPLEFSDDKTFHLTCLAATDEGYQNLLKINYLSNLKPTDNIRVDGVEGSYAYKPRITEKILFQFQKGLVVTSGCRLSIVNQYIMAKQHHEAKNLLEEFKGNVENYFIELHVAHNEVEEELFHWLKSYAFQNNIPCLVANDFHYITKGDLEVWNLLGSVRRQLTVSNPDKINNDDFYIKSADEMWNRVLQLTNSKDDTIKIFEGFDRLDSIITSEAKVKKIPKIQKDDAEGELLRLLSQKLINFFGGREFIPEEYSKRLRKEYDVAVITGNCSYYLIVYELINWCKKNNITTPVGRGSAASLLMLYLLGITKVDPIAYGLIAERASNAQRKKEMDIDLDFGQGDCERVVQHIKDMYGNDCVANIINYGYNKLNSSIRHVLSYLEVDAFKTNNITKAIKEKFVQYSYTAGDEVEEIEPKISNIERLPDFQEIFIKNGIYNTKEILRLAKGVEGTINSFSVHASGILISNSPIYSTYGVMRVNNTLCSTSDMSDLSDMGSLKLDALTVKTYNKITETIEMYNKHQSIKAERKLILK